MFLLYIDFFTNKLYMQTGSGMNLQLVMMI